MVVDEFGGSPPRFTTVITGAVVFAQPAQPMFELRVVSLKAGIRRSPLGQGCSKFPCHLGLCCQVTDTLPQLRWCHRFVVRFRKLDNQSLDFCQGLSLFSTLALPQVSPKEGRTWDTWSHRSRHGYLISHVLLYLLAEALRAPQTEFARK